MHPFPKWFVLRRAAGGTRAANRYLCDSCYERYQELGLIDGPGLKTAPGRKNAYGHGPAFRIRDEVPL